MNQGCWDEQGLGAVSISVLMRPKAGQLSDCRESLGGRGCLLELERQERGAATDRRGLPQRRAMRTDTEPSSLWP